MNSEERPFAVIPNCSTLLNSVMPIRTASILVVATAMTQAFASALIAKMIHPAFLLMYNYGSKTSLDETRMFIPQITRLASENSWLIAIVLATVCLCSLVALRRYPERTVECIAVGLCGQGLVTWSAMFCFFFFGFLGSGGVNRQPKFEVDQFLSFGGAIFPATLVLVIAPVIAALWPRKAASDSGDSEGNLGCG